MVQQQLAHGVFGQSTFFLKKKVSLLWSERLLFVARARALDRAIRDFDSFEMHLKPPLPSSVSKGSLKSERERWNEEEEAGGAIILPSSNCD